MILFKSESLWLSMPKCKREIGLIEQMKELFLLELHFILVGLLSLFLLPSLKGSFYFFSFSLLPQGFSVLPSFKYLISFSMTTCL